MDKPKCRNLIFIHGFNNAVYAHCGDLIHNLNKEVEVMVCTDCGGKYEIVKPKEDK